MDPIATRPQSKREALDGALADAVARMRNEAAVAAGCFVGMREALAAAPDAEACAYLVKKLVATALSSWTPPTSDPEAFHACAQRAGFAVSLYGKNAAVVRENAYPTSAGPLMKSICRAFADDVLKPGLARLRSFKKPDPHARALMDNLADLVKLGSLEAPTSPKVPPAPRFVIK